MRASFEDEPLSENGLLTQMRFDGSRDAELNSFDDDASEDRAILSLPYR